MKIIKILFKIFAVGIIAVALLLACIVLYMEFFGKRQIETALSGIFGSETRFKNISLDLSRYLISFKDLSILSKIDFQRNILNAEVCTLALDKDKLKNEGKIVIEEIIIRKGELNIERNKEGAFNISYDDIKNLYDKHAPTAKDNIIESKNLYHFAKYVKRLTIEDSIINFKDSYIPQGPFSITCDNLKLYFISPSRPAPLADSIPLEWSLKFKVPEEQYGNGNLSLDADMVAYESKTDMETIIIAKHINLMQFLPYFESYTPFSFNEGIFSSTMNFKMRDNNVDLLTTIVFHRLNLLVKPGTQNAKFLEASVTRLSKYLMSRQGEIIFDFVVKGPAHKPRVGLGPQIRFPMGLLVIGELGNLMHQLKRYDQRRL